MPEKHHKAGQRYHKDQSWLSRIHRRIHQKPPENPQRQILLNRICIRWQPCDTGIQQVIRQDKLLDFAGSSAQSLQVQNPICHPISGTHLFTTCQHEHWPEPTFLTHDEKLNHWRYWLFVLFQYRKQNGAQDHGWQMALATVPLQRQVHKDINVPFLLNVGSWRYRNCFCWATSE